MDFWGIQQPSGSITIVNWMGFHWRQNLRLAFSLFLFLFFSGRLFGRLVFSCFWLLSCGFTCGLLLFRLVFNSGAYGGFKPVPGANLPGAEHAGGPYRIPHARIEAVQVYTNSVPGGFFRGPGGVQAIFAIESHMDIIARRLGISRTRERAAATPATAGVSGV